MTSCYFIPPGQFFHWELSALRDAYEGAVWRPRERWHRAEQAHRQLGVDIESFGGEIEQERWDRLAQEDALDGEMRAVERTLELIRHAFTISLFHFWERWIVQEMRMELMYRKDVADPDKEKRLREMRYRHDRVVGFLRRHGLAPDPRGLRTLQLVANIAKHSGGHDDAELFMLRPDVFEERKLGTRGTIYELRLSDAFVDEMFGLVSSVGPSLARDDSAQPDGRS
ncbi:MAG TPA: hypothetical protein VK533_11175 [Sphingomonas sp.]|uniref:hypothetical protein n=1 Tax=Sphingomonas sp. TaxID=28214 RepID=UPI002BA50750|nr:hypothetical protein [Sphingomonas sp.]HMI20096.1 hypothetical protein [Sphingomonas sp.]